jgi:type I restriction enzyme R subunit
VSGIRGNESTFEASTIERLKLLGYEYAYGPELDRDPTQVVLVDVLRDNLRARYPELSAAELAAAVERITRPEGADTLTRNKTFHADVLTRGFELRVDRTLFVSDVHAAGRPLLTGPADAEVVHIHPVDWEHPERNRFQVVNQLRLAGPDRIPDIVVFVNGLPLVVFELKNPWDENANVDDAHNQLQHYGALCPRLFEFNAFCVASDGNDSLHGMWTAGLEWYAPWKSVDGRHVEAAKTGSMATLINGLFPKQRLLAYIRQFVLFEVDKAGIVKKGAKYHQFFAVRAAVERTLAAFQSDNRRIGVVWHTTGSGKSLSMAFLVGILRHHPALGSPAFVIQVDRTDLDDQLYDQFAVARHLVGPVQHAESVDQLRALLRTEGSEVVFTTIEKFGLKRGPDGKLIETTHPRLSDRSDIIVIADEAHRSQYGFLDGFARYMGEALPNAKRIGFTGTPLSFGGVNGSLDASETVNVFGDYIHTYDIRQAQEDGATVAIFYSPRKTDLHLKDGDIDKALADAATQEGVDGSDLESKKSRWAALAELAGAEGRVEAIAEDILQHYLERSATLAGKGMVVCMTRKNCVRLYDALTALPDCPEVKVIMTGDLKADPKEWSQRGHITSKAERDAIKKRMVDPDDPLKLVIVCDMWLTGTDIPCLHTLYVDKPMRGLNMIQAISRVNRVFRDKPHGLVVDYIGVGDELRQAADTYRKGKGTGEPAPDIAEKAVPLFLECLDAVRAALPEGGAWGAWRELSPIAFEDLHTEVYAWLAEDDDRRDAFVQAEHRLFNAYLLVRTLDVGRDNADEVLFHQRVRKQVLKTKPGTKVKKSLEQAVHDLVDDHVASKGVVDIFELAGIERPDISILDDAFLQTFKDRPHEDLRLKLLMKLLADELTRRAAGNLAQTKSFRALLEETIKRYHKRIIDAAAVVQVMVQIRKERDATDMRVAELGLTVEELAFYDAVRDNYASVYDEPFLRDLVHDVVQAVKGNLKVDWTEPHREDVKASVKAAVKRVLKRRGVKPEDFDGLTSAVLVQATALWKDWAGVA